MVAELPSRFKFKKTLHESSFGSVLVVWDVQAKKDVVIKRFDPEHHAAYLREVSAGFGLKHQSLVYCLETFYLEDNTGCLVFEYFPQGNLLQYMNTVGQLSVPEAIQCLKSLLSALIYLHESGRIHCDIKPSNIFLRSSSVKAFEFVLGDFGVACSAREAQLQRYAAGSPAYTAPERLIGGFEPNSDLYSLGILGYELLVGVRPFQGSVDEIRRAHNAKQPDLSKVSCQAMRDFLASLLAKSQMARMPTARLAYRVLTQVEAGVKYQRIAEGGTKRRAVMLAKSRSPIRSLSAKSKGSVDAVSRNGRKGSAQNWQRVSAFLLESAPRSLMLVEVEGVPLVGAQYDNHMEFYDLLGSLVPNLTIVGTLHQLGPGAEQILYYAAYSVLSLALATGERRCLLSDCHDLRAFAWRDGTLAWCDTRAWHLQGVQADQLVDRPMHQYAFSPLACVMGPQKFLLTDGVMNQTLILLDLLQACERKWHVDGPIMAVAPSASSALALTLGTDQSLGQSLWYIDYHEGCRQMPLTFRPTSACVVGDSLWLHEQASQTIFRVTQRMCVEPIGRGINGASHLAVDAQARTLAMLATIEKQHYEVRVWQR